MDEPQRRQWWSAVEQTEAESLLLFYRKCWSKDNQEKFFGSWFILTLSLHSTPDSILLINPFFSFHFISSVCLISFHPLKFIITAQYILAVFSPPSNDVMNHAERMMWFFSFFSFLSPQDGIFFNHLLLLSKKKKKKRDSTSLQTFCLCWLVSFS